MKYLSNSNYCFEMSRKIPHEDNYYVDVIVYELNNGVPEILFTGIVTSLYLTDVNKDWEYLLK